MELIMVSKEINSPGREHMSHGNLEGHLGYWLRLVSKQLSAAFAHALQERELSVAEWVALNQIDAAPGLSCAALAAAMGMTRGAISKIVDKLQDKQWMARAISAGDNRVQVLSLTRRGRRLLPELTRIADANDTHFFGALSSAEQATLRNLLRKLAAAHHGGGRAANPGES
jgi:DNA-binding MarR family transcriptional regulator